ncbi:MAG: hypothetical protein QNJ45_02150 [Ardenticatenaceae bacterium]|nr:hypothetical protein [Ardenticatenaceae bacterium]
MHTNFWLWGRYGLILLTGFAVFFFGLLALGTVPAPSTRTATVVTGELVRATEPHPDYGDMSIILDGGRIFYVNRANELDYFDWRGFLNDVQPGEQVTLTAVDTLARRLVGFGGEVRPVAGVQTVEKIYMDPAVSADRWVYQGRFMANSIIAVGILLLLLLPDVHRRFNSLENA